MNSDENFAFFYVEGSSNARMPGLAINLRKDRENNLLNFCQFFRCSSL